MTPTILFEDADLVVVDKPAGMIVHSDGKHDYPELDTWLREKLKANVFLVHRIDRQTSGVLVVTKNEAAYEFLKQQFKEREVRKTYRAFVYGNFKDERGIIDKPIGSARGGLGPRSARTPYGTIRDAVTMYRVIKNGSTTLTTSGQKESCSYVEVFPKTGRTHQIRVHFAAVQHPVVCDELYAPGRPKILGFERLALHAFSIAFRHPPAISAGQATKEMTFEAPLPADFLAAEKSLTL
jgi:23S rRNA pseudouridine1911/1915/1917 synthase